MECIYTLSNNLRESDCDDSAGTLPLVTTIIRVIPRIQYDNVRAAKMGADLNKLIPTKTTVK